MHTLTVNIQDSVFQEFLNFVSKRKETIEITKDKNLELDPYFYERQNLVRSKTTRHLANAIPRTRKKEQCNHKIQRQMEK